MDGNAGIVDLGAEVEELKDEMRQMKKFKRKID